MTARRKDAQRTGDDRGVGVRAAGHGDGGGHRQAGFQQVGGADLVGDQDERLVGGGARLAVQVGQHTAADLPDVRRPFGEGGIVQCGDGSGVGVDGLADGDGYRLAVVRPLDGLVAQILVLGDVAVDLHDVGLFVLALFAQQGGQVEQSGGYGVEGVGDLLRGVAADAVRQRCPGEWPVGAVDDAEGCAGCGGVPGVGAAVGHRAPGVSAWSPTVSARARKTRAVEVAPGS